MVVIISASAFLGPFHRMMPFSSGHQRGGGGVVTVRPGLRQLLEARTVSRIPIGQHEERAHVLRGRPAEVVRRRPRRSALMPSRMLMAQPRPETDPCNLRPQPRDHLKWGALFLSPAAQPCQGRGSHRGPPLWMSFWIRGLVLVCPCRGLSRALSGKGSILS